MVAANVSLNIADLRTTGDNIQENVDQVISNITPEATPILSKLGRETKRTPSFDWLIDANDPPTPNNAHFDDALFGAITTGDTTVAPTRYGNYSQIHQKHVRIPHRTERADKHGRRSEMAYQKAKKMPALKTDVEMSFTANQGAVLEVPNTTAGRTAGLPVWIQTNDDFGVGGASGAFTGSGAATRFPTTARTDGTLRALSEATLLTVHRNAWIAGGTAANKDIYVYPTIKERMNAWLLSSSSRTATQFQDQGPRARRGMTVNGAVDFWVTSFGVVEIIPSRNQRERDVFVLDTPMFKIHQFEPPFTKKMGARGMFEEEVIRWDCGLKSKNEAASAGVFDIQDVAMTA